MSFTPIRRGVISLLAMLLVLGLALPAPASAAEFTISDFTPANGATVTAGQEVVVSAFIVTDSEIALVSGKPDVQVVIDGATATPQFVVGSRAERVGFRVNQAFAAGQHTVNVTARSILGTTQTASWSFTAATSAATATATAAATVTPSPTAATATATPSPAPQMLPKAGGLPFGSLAEVAGLGLALVYLGRRVRGR